MLQLAFLLSNISQTSFHAHVTLPRSCRGGMFCCENAPRRGWLSGSLPAKEKQPEVEGVGGGGFGGYQQIVGPEQPVVCGIPSPRDGHDLERGEEEGELGS